MYCPNCGQQQMSSEVRFCSRCGLALAGLAEWLAGIGVPKRYTETSISELSPRRKAIRRAAKLMFFAGVLMPVFLLFCAVIRHGEPMIVPISMFFVALVWMLYAWLFGDKTAPEIYQPPQPSIFSSPVTRTSLPSPANIPIPGVGRQQVRTNELAQPPSVTEHTTKFFDSE